ncbi:hypothetical protein [Methylomonas albis]|nr:hypothetical protein [Methylomonas albis]
MRERVVRGLDSVIGRTGCGNAGFVHTLSVCFWGSVASACMGRAFALTA